MSWIETKGEIISGSSEQSLKSHDNRKGEWNGHRLGFG